MPCRRLPWVFEPWVPVGPTADNSPFGIAELGARLLDRDGRARGGLTVNKLRDWRRRGVPVDQSDTAAVVITGLLPYAVELWGPGWFAACERDNPNAGSSPDAAGGGG